MGLYHGVYNRQLHILQFVYVLLGCSWENRRDQDCFVGVVNIAQLLPIQQSVVLSRGSLLVLLSVGILFFAGLLAVAFSFSSSCSSCCSRWQKAPVDLLVMCVSSSVLVLLCSLV